MMELKYLPEPDSRIVLWRNTIQLFHEMKILIKNYLSEYLEFKDNKYISTGKFKQHHKTMQYVVLKLGDWAGISGQKTFDLQ